MNSYFLFFSHFLKNPKAVGAAAPLSNGVIKQIVKYLNSHNIDRPRRILEVGAGIGNVTRAIIKLLAPQDRLEIIEINPEYTKFLNDHFGHNANVSIECLSIIDWKPDYQYDFIISTLPFNSFEPEFIEKIFSHYQMLLAPNGVLSYVEYIGLQEIGLAFAKGKKKQIIHKRKRLLKKLQNHCLIEKKQIYGNFLPCNIYHMDMHKSSG